jgi:hypothetical protein
MCELDESFGSIKLNKILFNADFGAYALWGKPITGVDYFALENGPAPRPMKKILRLMQENEEIAIREKDYYGFDQHRVFPLRSADIKKLFSVDEINLVFRVIQKCWGRSGKSMSEESHEFLGWSAAALEETIPYSVALVGTRGPTKGEIRRGLELRSMAEECLADNASRKAPRNHRGA